MKYALLLAAASVFMCGQDAKVAPPKDAEPAPATPERKLSETEVLKIQLLSAKIELVQDKYKIQDFNKEIAPLSAEQNELVKSVCKSIGIPDEKIQTECMLNTGVGADGKPLAGADGKPVQARVWWSKPDPPKGK